MSVRRPRIVAAKHPLMEALGEMMYALKLVEDPRDRMESILAAMGFLQGELRVAALSIARPTSGPT